MESTGVISHWNDDKGFGFIRPTAGGEDVFLHRSAFRGNRRPQVGDQVSFVAGKNAQGRLRAEHASLAGLAIEEPGIRSQPAAHVTQEQARPGGESRSLQRSRLKLAIFLSLCLLPASAGIRVLLAGKVPWVLLVYPVVSLLSFASYWDDKRRAERGAWRTSEAALHLFELLGGWPGALIAQQVFRHKTRKVSFQVVFWSIVLFHQLFWAAVVFLPRGR